VCALPTPIKIDRLLPLLQGYVVKVVLMLFEGFTFEGFTLPKKLISANQNPGVVSAKLAKEIVAGRIVGPSPPPLFQFPCISFGGCA
jgi:hypothetical protein